jgi:hypothetical protein
MEGFFVIRLFMLCDASAVLACYTSLMTMKNSIFLIVHRSTFVQRSFSVTKGVVAMFTIIPIVKGTSRHCTLLWRIGVFPLLIILLVSGFVGGGTAHASAQLFPLTVSSQSADSAPAMASSNTGVYIGWTGRNATHNLNLMTFDAANRIFGPAHVLTDTTLVGSAPSLAEWNNNLYVAWQGKDNRLNVGLYNAANPTHLANKVTLNEHSNNAPSIGGWDDHLYLGWRGTDGRLNIITSTDGSHFGAKTTYPFAIRTSPTLNGTPFGLFVAWEDMTASSHIVIATYGPSRLNAVTTTSTSQLPVSLDSYSGRVVAVVVAWRTANDVHIRMGTFNLSSVLQKPTITAYTTLYCPALYPNAMPIMSWTDANHAINGIWLPA